MGCCLSPHQNQHLTTSAGRVSRANHLTGCGTQSQRQRKLAFHDFFDRRCGETDMGGQQSAIYSSRVPIIADQSRSRMMIACDPLPRCTLRRNSSRDKQDHDVAQRMDMTHALQYEIRLHKGVVRLQQLVLLPKRRINARIEFRRSSVLGA